MKNELLKMPCYMLDAAKLEENFLDVRDNFESAWPNLILGYSFKTNSLPWILKWMKEQGAFAEVVSEQEYNLALKVGFPISKIILNGPFKGMNCLRDALNGGAIVNLDSFSEVEWLSKNHSEENSWKVGLRFNFDLEGECPGETVMGKEPGRFGFNIENGSFERAVLLLAKLPHVKVVGLHAHHSTKTRSLKVFKTLTLKLLEASSFLNEEVLEYVDIGGGFFGGQKDNSFFSNFPTMEQYSKRIAEILSRRFSAEKVSLIIEPGASIVASAITYHCKVVDIRDVPGCRIVTVNGSRLNLDPQMHSSNLQWEGYPSGHDIISKQIICGYTCMENDRLVTILDQPELRIGDMVKFHGVGSYGMALTPMFIKYLPAVYVDIGQQIFCIRKEWSVDEYTAGCLF